MTNREVISNFLERKRREIISRINQATGRTARRIFSVVDHAGGTLYGPSYIEALEDGRGPTRVATPSKPTLREAIEEWLEHRSFSLKPGQTKKSLSYAIAASIHRQGTRLFQRGGKSGVLSQTITEQSFDELLEQLADVNSVTIATEVVNKFKLELKRNV